MICSFLGFPEMINIVRYLLRNPLYIVTFQYSCSYLPQNPKMFVTYPCFNLRHVRTHTQAQSRTHSHTCTHAHEHARAHTHTHVHTCTNTNTQTSSQDKEFFDYTECDKDAYLDDLEILDRDAQDAYFRQQCSVLQRVAVCCSVLQRGAACCSVMQCVVVCCSVLQCVAVCCSVLQRSWIAMRKTPVSGNNAVCCSVL